MGAGIEFLRLSEIRERHGADGVAGYVTAYGRTGAITDDTQMALFTAEALLRGHNRFLLRGISSVSSVARYAYLRWLQTQDERGPDPTADGNIDWGWLVDQPALRHRRAPGTTCLAALRQGGDGTIENPINDSKGCGTIMRTAPLALMPGDVFQAACEVGALTHGHPSGYLSAGAFTVILATQLEGQPLEVGIGNALKAIDEEPQAREVVAALGRARELAARGEPTASSVEALGGGWVAEEALAIAVYCALSVSKSSGEDAFRRGLLLGVNHSGDSDSTGALVGNLLGATWGEEALPAMWLQGLEGRELIDRVANDLVRHFVDPPAAGSPKPGVPMIEELDTFADLDRYPGC